MERNDFRQRLLEIAQQEARNHRYHFLSGSENQIKRLIYEGVRRMNDHDLDSQLRRNEAERNIRRLVVKMIENARRRNLNESIDSYAFSSVHLSICPLWPFC